MDSLRGIQIPGVTTFVEPVKEHRACVVFPGNRTLGDLHDTDPGLVGEKPLEVTITSPNAEFAAGVVREFISEAMESLAAELPPTGLLLRGFALHEDLPGLGERLQLNSAAVALYPMYRGVASLAGMTLYDSHPADIQGEVEAAHTALKDGRNFVFLAPQVHRQLRRGRRLPQKDFRDREVRQSGSFNARVRIRRDLRYR